MKILKWFELHCELKYLTWKYLFAILKKKSLVCCFKIFYALNSVMVIKWVNWLLRTIVCIKCHP